MKTQIEKELNEMMEKFNETKKANTVKDDFPESKKTYSYRKTTILHAHDLAI
jgi:tryptophan synthase beta subunit